MFYLKKDGLIYGPYDPDVLRKKAAEGFFGPTDLIKKENGPWYSAYKIKSFKFGADKEEQTNSLKQNSIVDVRDKNLSDKEESKKNIQSKPVNIDVVYEYLGEEDEQPLSREIDLLKPKSKKSKFLRKKSRSKWALKLGALSLILGLLAVGGYLGIQRKFSALVQLGIKEEALPEPFELAVKNKAENEPVNNNENNKGFKDPNNQAVVPPKPIQGFKKRFINIGTEMIRYGYQSELSNYSNLSRFAKFGSLANSRLAVAGNPFEKGDALKRASEWREKLRDYFFFTDKVRLQFPAGTDFENDGLVMNLKMPFKLAPRLEPFDKNTKLEGVVSSINCEDFDDGSFGFLRKDSKLQPCTGQEALIVKKNNGVLYVRESTQSSIKISLKGNRDILKAFYDNRAKAAVECGFSGLEFGKAVHWGYFKLDWLLIHEKNTDAAFIGFESGLFALNDEPTYFCFEFDAAPEMVLAKLLYLKIRDHRGVEIGSVVIDD
jgi:hypothetical protein